MCFFAGCSAWICVVFCMDLGGKSVFEKCKKKHVNEIILFLLYNLFILYFFAILARTVPSPSP